MSYDYEFFAPGLPSFEAVREKVLSEWPTASVEPHEDGVRVVLDEKVLIVRRTAHPLVHETPSTEEIRKALQPYSMMYPATPVLEQPEKNRKQRRREAALRRKT